MPTLIALVAVFLRVLVWQIFSGAPASEDWELFYNPASILLAQRWNLNLQHDALVISPLYTLFLALTTTLFGSGTSGMRLAQSLLDGLTVWGTYAIGQRVFSRRVGLLGALAFAFYPLSIYMTGLGQPEWLLALALVGATLVWATARQTNQYRTYFILGIWLGICLLLKPNYLGLYPFWLALEVLFSTQPRGRTVLNLLTAAAGIIVVRMSWGLIHTAPYDMNASLVYARVFYFGSSLRPALTDGSLMPLTEFYIRTGRIAAEQLGPAWNSPGQVLQALISNWLMLLISNPLNLIELLILKFSQVWYATDSGTLDRYMRWFQLPFALITLIGFGAAWQSRAQRILAWPLLIFSGYTIIALLMITPLVRELMPVMPLLLLFAAYGLDRAWEWQRVRRL